MITHKVGVKNLATREFEGFYVQFGGFMRLLFLIFKFIIEC